MSDAAPPAGEASSPRLGALLFGLNAPVSRRAYLVTGVTLMLFKYALDATLIYTFAGVIWTPWEYLSPAFVTREAFASQTDWLLPVLAVLTLPFVWIGLTMSVRRAADAGIAPAFGLAFVLPGLNYAAMIGLACLPSAPVEQRTTPPTGAPASRVQAAIVGVGIGAAIGVAMAAFSVFALRSYGGVLFFATPVVMGAACGWWLNRGAPRGVGPTLGAATLTVLVAGGALLLFAIEGLVCLLMTLPIAWVLALVGALVGRFAAIASPTPRPMQALLLLLALPLTAGFESSLPTPERLREVVSHTIIDAPPEAVWPHVIGFSDLPPPHELIFEAGIAYPMRARIEGAGVGAVRHCEFSTGAFVEPITRWEPPHRLSFDVVSQPRPMHETSPYRHLHPPHLDGYFRSRKGEFRLIALPDGRTRLEGSTWYALDLAPTAYWAVWSDALVHAIHTRVLDHIERRVVAEQAR